LTEIVFLSFTWSLIRMDPLPPNSAPHSLYKLDQTKVKADPEQLTTLLYAGAEYDMKYFKFFLFSGNAAGNSYTQSRRGQSHSRFRQLNQEIIRGAIARRTKKD
jgi:hypothetical protein